MKLKPAREGASMSRSALKAATAEPERRGDPCETAWLGWGMLLAICATLFLITFCVLAGPSTQLALYRLILDGSLTFAWIISMIGFGWIAWRLIVPSTGWHMHPMQKAVTCAALGMGGVSLLVLILGLLGWLNFSVALGLIIGGDCVAVSAAWLRWRDLRVQWLLKAPARWNWIWAPISVLAAVVVIGACFPPGLLWGDEPNGYDVAEYHLQVPREWYEAGRIVPLTHNVFSYFPFNAEMHYLLATHLHGGPWAGMYLAQMMHTAMCGLAVLAVYGLAGGGRSGAIAAALVAATPWTGLLGAVAYDDGGTLLWGTLAIGWALKSGCGRGAVIAGCMAGFAAGAKLSIAPLLFIAIPAAIFIAKLIDDTLWHAIRRTGIYLFVGLVMLSPWLIRNYAWAGNPVFPEAMSILGHAHFSPVQVQRWQLAYEPNAEHRGFAGHGKAIYEQVFGDWRYGILLIPLACVAFALTINSRCTRQLAWLIFFQLAFWLTFTHLQGRFMVILIPLCALLIGQAQSRRWWIACTAAAVLLAAISTTELIVKLSRFLQADRQLSETGPGLIGRENLNGLRMLDTSRLRDNISVDLVGDSCAFLYQIPMSRLHYKTVFDVDTGDPEKTIVQSWLFGMPTDALVFPDTAELDRFARTYYGIPKPAPDPHKLP